MTERPFLTILTRCSPYREEHFLERCKASVVSQTDQDLEHVLVRGGDNFAEAIKSVAEAKPLVHGKMVLILDDDDFLFNPRSVEKLKEVWEQEGPDVIMVRQMRMGEPFPSDDRWEQKPRSGHIGGQNYVVRGEVWHAHIDTYSSYEWGGDHHFIGELWDRGYEFYWLDVMMVETDNIGVLKDHKGRRQLGG